MTEDELIKKYFTSSKSIDDVELGIGDDAAILNVPVNYQLVTSVDTLLEDVHFPASLSPSDLASRAIAVCVSDLAAMGAQPKWLTLALSIPGIDHAWLESFSQSLLDSCDQYGMRLVGGDTVKGSLAITLNVMGIVKKNQALRRDGAKPGDLVYVSGTLGGAALALHQLQSSREVESGLLDHFTRPCARVGLGKAILAMATSCMDVSDGILLDCSRLASASKVGMQVNLEEIPLHPALMNLSIQDALKYASAGDDYELLFSIPEKFIEQLTAISGELDIAVTRIGTILKKPGLKMLLNNNAFVSDVYGYQHFKNTI